VAAVAIVPNAASAAVAAPVLTVGAQDTGTYSTPHTEVTIAVNTPWHIDSCNTSNVWEQLYLEERVDPQTQLFGLDRQMPGEQLDVNCDLYRNVKHTDNETLTGRVIHYGGNTSSRSISGNCNWGGDGSGGLLATCAYGHSTANYTLQLPRGKRFSRITHSCSSGLFRCHGAWSVHHTAGTRTWHVSFDSGNSTGWSQCDIANVALHYYWHRTYTYTTQVAGYADGSTIVG